MNSERRLVKKKGFSLIENLLTVAIIALMASASIPLLSGSLTKNDLNTSKHISLNIIRKAQGLAMSQSEDSNWGVSLQSNSLVLYKGDSYAARDTSFDESYDLPNSISISGFTGTNFQTLSGRPDSTSTILISTSNGESTSITINSMTVVTQ